MVVLKGKFSMTRPNYRRHSYIRLFLLLFSKNSIFARHVVVERSRFACLLWRPRYNGLFVFCALKSFMLILYVRYLVYLGMAD